MGSSHDDRDIDLLATGAVTRDGAAPSALPLAAAHRFAPGAIIAGRYRLVAMLGRGGMGEVYRADDLTLGQPVALKFLPPGVAAGDNRLSRFHNELRTARQVSHKNVCRLYDLGEADGQRFLTMEYVDGEDLASLLRRIGRLPPDKAVQMARQLCAGMAAAHERGVLHRDLKPANVMVDGEGDLRILDFGIATAVSDTAHELVGTPQYMAPELLAGQPASVQSDVYALGLTLYEIFTGRRAHDAKTVADLKQLHDTGTLTTPTSIVRDLDPAIERTILRCLDHDPARRPASALAVAAALPGGDALAEALAAGETPSPQLLAAAGEAQAVGVVPGLALLTLVVVGLVVFVSLSPRLSIAGRTPLDRPPAVLVDRVERLLGTLGYTDVPADTESGFTLDGDFISWVVRSRRSPDRWDVLNASYPSAMRFWYRSSPLTLRPFEEEIVTPTDPPLTVNQMRLVVLDSEGRLQEFRSVPSQVEEPDAPAAVPPWPALFDAAGLDMAGFAPTSSQWAPLDFADTRKAWAGPVPGRADLQLRVEAAANRGRVVSFMVVGPWTVPRVAARRASAVDRAAVLVVLAIIAALFTAAAMMARRNLRANRADRDGAWRLVRVLGALTVAQWVLGAHHVGDGDGEFELLMRATGDIALFCVILWMMYLALESTIRRFWPHSLLGWSRLLTGHVRDPRVGRDILIGSVFGVMLAFTDVLRQLGLPWLGAIAPRPTLGARIALLDGAGPLAAQLVGWVPRAVQSALLTVLMIVLLRLLLRWRWLASSIAALLIGSVSLNYVMTTNSGLIWLGPVIVGGLVTVVTVRYGLLALVVARFVWNVLYGVPFTWDVSHWAAAPSNWAAALLLVLAAFGYYASRAGQPLFGKVLQDT